MTRHENDRPEIVDAHLGLFRSPPAEQMSHAEERTLRRLRSEPRHASATARPSRGFHLNWSFACAGAAAVVLLVMAAQWPNVRTSITGVDAAAVVEAADGGLYRGDGQRVPAGEPIALQDALRTNGGTGAVIKLADGSRVEMRSRSALSLERADDGVRIRLNQGGIIVNAAKQRRGHLYVQTKDVTVSVIGTVFLVNAEAQGSRVAVIEGEVRVQQGTTEQKLLPGQQVATNASIDTRPVREEIAWSRNAPALLSLLQQSAVVVPPVITPQSAVAPREVFEVVSIRPRPATGGPGRSGSPFVSGLPPACGASLRIDPRLFRATNITVYELITIAYGKECDFAEEAPDPEAGGLLGGPEWIRTMRYDLEANRPEDSTDYTSRAYGGGPGNQYTPGPKLRRMVQTMLADRFRLAMRREMREMAVYELVVSRGGLKLPPQKGSKGFTSYVGGAGLYEAIKNSINPRPEYGGLIVSAISATGASMTDLAEQLSRLTGRPVLNRTGVEGVFTYEFFFAPERWRYWRRDPTETRPHLMSPSLFTVLEEDLGLRLEEARRPVEVLFVDRVERPTEN